MPDIGISPFREMSKECLDSIRSYIEAAFNLLVLHSQKCPPLKECNLEESISLVNCKGLIRGYFRF